MTMWLILLVSFYLFCLVVSSRYALKVTRNIEQTAALNPIASITNNPSKFFNIGIAFGILTYAATLFSTFTLMGMPDFFREHGVGAWIFLGVTDVAMAFLVIFIGLRLRLRFRARGHFNITELLRSYYNSNFASLVFIVGVFVFLIPYVAIQIQGISRFLALAIDVGISDYVWAFVILFTILMYCLFGGFRAIIYNDAVQAIFLLIASWAVAWVCIDKVGGVSELFKSVAEANPALLTTPGPKGLFSWQFLLSSFIAIAIMPVTQPQLTARIVAMKSTNTLRVMAPALAFFAIIVIFPAVILGMYGALNYSSANATEFLKGVLIDEQSPFIAALVIIGLISAAMSTADSQIFALSSESEQFFKVKNKSVTLHKNATNNTQNNVPNNVKNGGQNSGQKNTKKNIFIIAFVVLTFIFCIFAKSELVLLARVSFVGTSIAAPMILLAVFGGDNLRFKSVVPVATALMMLIYLLSLFTDLVPDKVFDLRIELMIYVVLTLITLSLITLSYIFTNNYVAIKEQQ